MNSYNFRLGRESAFNNIQHNHPVWLVAMIATYLYDDDEHLNTVYIHLNAYERKEHQFDQIDIFCRNRYYVLDIFYRSA